MVLIKIPLPCFCDNINAIKNSRNHVQHSRIKHIDIRYHFIRDLVERKVIVLEHIHTEGQLAALFTKALDIARFGTLQRPWAFA